MRGTEAVARRRLSRPDGGRPRTDIQTTRPQLFYGLSIIGSISEGTKGFEMQGRAVALLESVYARDRSIRESCTT